MERGENTRKISTGTFPLRTMMGDGTGRIISQTGWLEQTIQPREEAEGVPPLLAENSRDLELKIPKLCVARRLGLSIPFLILRLSLSFVCAIVITQEKQYSRINLFFSIF